MFIYQSRQLCPLLCVGMNAKIDIFVQKEMCTFFTLNVTMLEQYVSVNIMYKHYSYAVTYSVLLIIGSMSQKLYV
jgi:hypothetical protein